MRTSISIFLASALLLAGCGGASDGDSDSGTNGSSGDGGAENTPMETVFSPPGPITVEVGDDIGDFTAADIDGNVIKLSDYRGRVVLLDFWATWCEVCHREMPVMMEVYEKYRSEGFEIIAVSVDGENKEADLRAYLKRHDIQWRQIYTGDPRWRTPIAVRYDIGQIPAPWLIGKDGRVVSKGARGEHLDPLVRKALDEPWPPSGSEE